jgi:SAM-dependent methyltransferase
MKVNQSDYLLFSSEQTYEEARHHSQQLDEALGFEVAAIENKLLETAQLQLPQGSHKTWGPAIHQGNQTWVGLSHQTLQTPYAELKKMCELLKPKSGALVLDLGAGYGRLGLILKWFYPEVKFCGYELVQERVDEGKRIYDLHSCHDALLIQKDLTSDEFELPEADAYLIYDYGTVAHIRKTLQQIEKIADRKKIKVIGRGQGTRSLIENEHPWLSQVYPIIHQEHFSIYSMSEV